MNLVIRSFAVFATLFVIDDSIHAFVVRHRNHVVTTSSTYHRYANLMHTSQNMVRSASTVNDDVKDVQLDGKELINKLRSSKVTNVDDELVSLGDIMGMEKSVVVFLRHLG
jgi:hypothetical protein